VVLLVPPLSRRVGRFEFRGISIPSGDVGGDLVDLVEWDGQWIGYVADVSGHGVGAGLLMAMVKSAARTELRPMRPIDQLLNTLNVVLLDLKKPEMFVTFAGIQFDGARELRFTVAGHLPILHYRSEARVLEELSTPQIPLAMVGERSFIAARVGCGVGDLFVILTDGLTEVFDGDDREFGLHHVKALVQEHVASPLEHLERALLTATSAHGPQLDDQTLLLIRVVA
jgi:phosphoserine phosphatase RsbU/P